MPPSGDLQQDTVTDVVINLGVWIRSHRDYVLATNEAGMRLKGSTRAADAAIWRRSEVGSYTGGLRRVPPVLAVEVAGDDETEDMLRDKAGWYRSVGVEIVWLVLPKAREVLVISGKTERRYKGTQALAPNPSLPDMSVKANQLFAQISAG